jgi:hypothetical protein
MNTDRSAACAVCRVFPIQEVHRGAERETKGWGVADDEEKVNGRGLKCSESKCKEGAHFAF